ncbi:hypothetical protein AAKU55_002390 [Oxalobacteraceae bacterium GrIS 1.11]
MKLKNAPILRGLLLLACVVSFPCHADWATSADPTVVHALPSDSRTQPQNPPGFTWSRHASNPTSYVIEITGKTIQTYTTDRNWFLPTTALPAGHYTWRVRPGTAAAGAPDWSSPRDFYIDASSKTFEVPDNATLQSRILTRALPRSLPPEVNVQSAWSPAMAADRTPLLGRLSIEVLGKVTTLAVPKDSNWLASTVGLLSAAGAAQLVAIRWAINDTGRQLEAASFIYHVTADKRFLTEALKRGDQLAALSPSGPTSFVNQDQGSRQIALSLIKAVDVLGPSLDATRRTAWLTAVATRTTDIYNDISGSNGRLDQQPFDSHGASNLGMLAVISTLALGNIPAANEWFNYSFRAYVHQVFPWSGPEGGFANGTAYAQFTADQALELWQPLKAATGVDLFAKPWSDGFLKFLTHFVPPGSPTHVFGDQHEVAPDMPTLKSFVSRFSSPTAAWYAKNLTGTEDTFRQLQSPWPLPVVATKTLQAPPNGAYYPSIGWVAMHSDIADRARTSLYFKSSPYGSYNHSHGDQNSLVLNSGGRQLMMEAGYEDWYASPLWNDWYHQTKSHNAITYDGGKGQKVDGVGSALSWNGKVISFATTSVLDFAAGDATASYGGNLTSALRQVWYFRNANIIVVQDKLLSPLPHVFEWNVHAPVSMVVGADKSVKITNVDRSVCIRSVTPDVSFKKWTGAPPLAGKFEDHGAFTKPSAKSVEFLMVLDVGCLKPSISLTSTTTGRTLKVGGNIITLPK